MIRIILSTIASFIFWLVAWFALEALLSFVGPDWFGAQQSAFQNALVAGGEFNPTPAYLVAQIILASISTVLSGFLASMLAKENKRTSTILGVLLLSLGLVKVTMSWGLIPIWHHLVFLMILVPLAKVGGKLRTDKSEPALS